VTEGRSEPGTVAPSTGVLRAALLLVHASDVPPDTGPIARGTFDAAAAWFRAVSYGRLDFRVEPTPPLALPATSAVYAGNPERYLRDAVSAADPHVDFASADVVYLAPASRTPEVLPTTANLHGFGVRADGKEIRLWIPWGAGFAVQAGEPGHLLHETGHLLGLPDLYATGALSTYHRWDVMAARWPAELLAWHRWKLGWLDARSVLCLPKRATRTVTLSPLERPGGRKAIFVKRGRRVLAIEVRTRAGYDRTLCETGVLVYSVDQTPFRRRPVQLYEAQAGGTEPRADCAARWNAPLGVRRGERRVLDLGEARIEVLARNRDGSFRVRVRAK
jgi:M6 family metalloprotease-like protein